MLLFITCMGQVGKSGCSFGCSVLLTLLQGSGRAWDRIILLANQGHHGIASDLSVASVPLAGLLCLLMPTESNTRKGLKIQSHFVKDNQDPFELFRFVSRDATIREATGRIIFEQKNVEVPEHWSQTATDILAQKYFRKRDVPLGDGTRGSECSIRQVVSRIAGCWADAGLQSGYFSSSSDANVFYNEMIYLMLSQKAAPNSPQWFNTGLFHAYGIKGPAQGHYYYDEKAGIVCKSESAYERPQPHACFILSVDDDLVNEGGIMDLWVKEARIFKYGSGSGTNFSAIRGRGELLSGGGESSGLMSFLKVGNTSAAAVKSGGTTRRAAKMVCLDADHPEIISFIRWKASEEKKARVLLAAGYSGGYEGEAYSSVSGQHSNNSVRLSDTFFDLLDRKAVWPLTSRVSGQVIEEIPAASLWDELALAAWACADPGVQFDTTINSWNTCPADARIRASNPCSEYMFLDNTSCNLASINLLAFYDAAANKFDIDGLVHTCRLLTIMLDISVGMAQYPSAAVAHNAWRYRTLGLGFANLGALLMQMGLAYDSDEGRTVAAALTALISASAWETSAELASALNPFEAFDRNREQLLQVLRNHISLLPGSIKVPVGLRNIPLKVSGIDNHGLFVEAERRYASALVLGERTGFRNAQLTVVAPTGTIGFVMDCDTTGIEPDFALVKYKKLSGGGFMRIVNQSVRPALIKLGYHSLQADAIILYLVGSGSIANLPHINRKRLDALGFTEDVLRRMEQLAPTVMHIRELFQLSVIGKDMLLNLGVPDTAWIDLTFDLPVFLGFTPDQIEEADKALVGHLTMEGAPFLKPEHYPVFDCAVMGSNGRSLSVDGHLKMMSVVQAFICGAISKTVNLPENADVETIKEVYLKSWKLGLKAISIYRDGSKGAQPLVIPQSNKSQSGIQMGGAAGDSRTWNLKLDGKDVVVNFRVHGADGRPELSIDLPEAEIPFRILLQCFARAVSIGLKSGVPLDAFVNNFIRTRFEPAGLTSDPHIRLTSSVLDLCFRLLGYHYLNRTDLANVSADADFYSDRLADSGKIPAGEVISWLYNFATSTPPCPFCGYPTIPSGNCYKCSNCGTSLGCT